MKKKTAIRIGVDLMGGETPPEEIFEGVLQAITLFSDLFFSVFVTRPLLSKISSKIPDAVINKIKIYVVSEFVKTEDAPLKAISQHHSSLAISLELLKKQEIHALVFFGNTGALLAKATLSVPLLPNIKRPALLALIPTLTHPVVILDVGGNIASQASHLWQFAKMGSIYYTHCLKNRAPPKVALLNVGSESGKGDISLRKAYNFFKKMQKNTSLMNFVGNIEGREVFQGDVDILITPGLMGNIFLKTAEGVSFLILETIRRIFQQKKGNNPFFLKELEKLFNYEEYGGAILCGVDAVIIKCHGKTSHKGVVHGIRKAANLVQDHFLESLKKHLICDFRD